LALIKNLNMKSLKIFLASFGIFYVIGVFLSGCFNPMDWVNIGKVAYLLFSLTTYSEASKDFK